MPYAQVHAGALRHRKVASLSDAAFRLWVASLAYCQEQLTDGVILDRMVHALGVRVSPRLITELVEARLWDVQPAGWTVHDYLDWNDSKALIEKRRQKWREKKAGSPRGVPLGKPPETPIEPPPWSAPQPSPGASPGNDTVRCGTVRDETSTPDHRERDLGGHAAGVPAPPSGPHDKHVFCGRQLHVPHYLHADFVDALGAAAERYDLEAWYQQLDDELLAAGGPPLLPDRDRWLKARFTEIMRDTFRGLTRRRRRA